MRPTTLLIALAIAATIVPARSVSATPHCFGEGRTFEKRSMQGHLDADGVVDDVWVGARHRDGRCRYFVFARTHAAGLSRVHIPVPGRLARVSIRDAARPVGLVRVDDVRGREVAVKLLEGASVRPFAFFTIRSGRIAWMEIGDTVPPLAARDMFAFGGGLSLMFGTSCAYGLGPRIVVFSRASPTKDPARYRVTRRWYQVRGAHLVRTSLRTQTEVVRLAHMQDRFPEFRNGGLLPRCDGRVLDPRRA